MYYKEILPTINNRKLIMPNFLDKTKIIETFGLKIADWQDALDRCIAANAKVRQ